MDVHILTLFLFLKRKPKSYVNMNLIEPQLDLATTLHLHSDFISSALIHVCWKCTVYFMNDL